MIAKKAPNPTDKHVGSRVRMRRMMLGMSQEKLGDALGLTFQQVQKYEKGTNRIGASRLQQISHILQVPVSFFFEGAPPAHTDRPPRRHGRGALAGLCVRLSRDLRRLGADQGVHAHRRFQTAAAHRRPRRANRRPRQSAEASFAARAAPSGQRPPFAHILTAQGYAATTTCSVRLSSVPASAFTASAETSAAGYRGECFAVAHANYLFTSESVSEGHPDKVCDQISDAMLDAFIENDIKLGIADDSAVNTRLGCETLCTTNKIVIAGEGRGQAPLFHKHRRQGGGQSRDDHRDRARRGQGYRLRPGRLLLLRRRRRSAAARPVARHRHGRRRQEEKRRRGRRRRRPGHDVRLRLHRERGLREGLVHAGADLFRAQDSQSAVGQAPLRRNCSICSPTPRARSP